jgi:hypothetical protein
MIFTAMTLFSVSARAIEAQAPAAAGGVVAGNIQPLSASAAPVQSNHDWQQSVESQAQTKWKRGGFGKKHKGAKKGKSGKHPRPTQQKQKRPAKKP